jgi:hypothetical protein
MDFKRSQAIVELENGARFSKSLPKGLSERSEFDFAKVDSSEGRFEFMHHSGTVVHAEIEPPGEIVLPQQPVLYLDQCHWITLARQLWAPEKVLEREREAAIKLIEMGRSGDVILPISSANLTEMTPADGKFRRDLGLTMLQLSRGWQMRNPVHVRGAELRGFFAGEKLPAEAVFTLAPKVLFIGSEPLAAPSEGDPIALYEERLKEIHAIYEIAVENEKIPNKEGLEQAEAWAQEQRRFALLLRQEKVSLQKAEHYAAGRLIFDLSTEFVAAAQHASYSESDLKGWLAGPIEDDINTLPFLGIFHRTVLDRVRNPQAKWEANHFNDIQFLSCATAYADIVVGEKETSEHLKRAQRGYDGAIVCRSLPEAVESLASLHGSQVTAHS